MDGEEAEDPTLSLFTNIPDEIIAKILSFLTLEEILQGPSRTSSRFRNLCGLHITSINFPPKIIPSLFKERQERERVFLALRHGLLPRLRSLVLRVHQSTFISVALEALEHCPMLEHLEVDCRYQCYPELYQALKDNGSLKRLTLRNAYVTFQGRTITGLTHLVFDRCEGPNDEELLSIGRNCPQLESYCCNKGRFSLEFGRKAATVFLLSVCSTIKEIKVPGDSIESEFYDVLGSLCKRLEKVTIFGARKMEGNALKAIVDLPKLKILFVTRCCNLVGQDFVEAFEISEERNRIKCMELGCPNLDDRGLKAVAEKCGDSLTFLSLPLSAITNVGVKCVIERCGKLERLHLQEINDVTTDVFGNVRNRLPNLREIRIYKCSGIDTEGLAKDLAESGIKVLF